MSRVIVSTDKDDIMIELPVNGKVKCLNRKCQETVGRTIERLYATMSKVQKKNKSKKAKMDVSTENTEEKYKATLLDKSNNQIAMETIGGEAWKVASTLQINDESFKVLYNIPKVSTLKVTAKPLVSMPVYPLLTFKNAMLNFTKFTWYRRKLGNFDDNAMECDNDENDEVSTSWHQISEESIYTPKHEDIGCLLKVVVHPGNEQSPADPNNNFPFKWAETANAVAAGPEKALFELIPNLKEFLSTKSGIRLISYNILAECYSTTELAKTDLFAYCDSRFIPIDYRLGLIFKELKAYNGDLIALQECDQSVFTQVLVPVMSIEGYAGAFGCKGQSKEGVALFFRKSRFQIISAENCIFGEAFKDGEVEEQIQHLLKHNTNLQEKVLRRGSCGLVCLLRDKINGGYLVVANTHLYFHPKASNIRIIQTSILLHVIQRMVKSGEEKCTDGKKVSYVLMGDMNSHYPSAAMELIRDGKVPGNHTEWWSGGGIEHPGAGQVTLKHDLDFTGVLGSRCYTNYAAGFYGHLDHIFISSQSLKSTQILDLPPHEKVIESTALPSEIHPSDHIAQVVDIDYI